MNADVAALTSSVTQFFLALYVLMLVEFRDPEQRWRKYWMISAGLLVAANMLWVALGYGAQYKRMGFFTLLFPYMLITLWCSKYRDARTLFGVSNASYMGCICGINGYVAQFLFPELSFLPMIVRLVSLIIIFFITMRFSRICRLMIRRLDQGWMVLWMIPLITSLISMTISGRFFWTSPVLSILAVYGLLAVCAVAYYLMYLFFIQVETKNEIETNQKILRMQVSGLLGRIEAVNTAEERLRIQRHDMRHQLQLLRELVQRGELDSVLSIVDTTQERLNDANPKRWCTFPILDAMFSSYFDQAQAQHIFLNTRIAFPEPLPVDEGELAIVFANILENSIHACVLLPEDKREIRCVVLAQPSLMLEISNPCAEDVRFNEQGLPLPQKSGHGLGTQSIAAFCQKYDAVYSFHQSEGYFTVQIVL